MKQRNLNLFALVFAVLAASAAAGAQTPARSSARSAPGIFLVFPFENAGASPRLDWLSEGLEELTIQKLSAAGQQVYSHAGRTAELDRYGLPQSARLSHATMLRIGAELDADYVVFGKFTSDGTSLTLQARILRVNPAGLQPVVQETGKLDSLDGRSSKARVETARRERPAVSLESRRILEVTAPAATRFVRALYPRFALE